MVSLVLKEKNAGKGILLIERLSNGDCRHRQNMQPSPYGNQKSRPERFYGAASWLPEGSNYYYDMIPTGLNLYPYI
jgi:hypothetical protein